MNEKAVIDIEALRRLLAVIGGDREGLAELIGDFREGLPELVGQIVLSNVSTCRTDLGI